MFSNLQPMYMGRHWSMNSSCSSSVQNSNSGLNRCHLFYVGFTYAANHERVTVLPCFSYTHLPSSMLNIIMHFCRVVNAYTSPSSRYPRCAKSMNAHQIKDVLCRPGCVDYRFSWNGKLKYLLLPQRTSASIFERFWRTESNVASQLKIPGV